MSIRYTHLSERLEKIGPQCGDHEVDMIDNEKWLIQYLMEKRISVLNCIY